MVSSDKPEIRGSRLRPDTSRAGSGRYPDTRPRSAAAAESPNESAHSESLQRQASAECPDYMDLFEHAPVGYMVLDTAGRIVTINFAGAAILGWDRSWLVGKSFSRWVLDDDQPLFQVHRQQLQESDECIRQALRIKNHQGRILRLRLETVRESASIDGKTTGVRSVLVDISGQEQSARKQRRLQSQLTHLARLQTAGELATSLAHELNQPLGTVVLNCDAAMRLLSSGRGRESEFAEALTQAAEAASFASEVIRHLRGFLRSGEKMLRVCTLPELMHDVCMLIEADALDHDIALQLDIERGLPSVRVDPIQIQQVLVNLVRNSIEALGAGHDRRSASIWIRAHRAPPGQIQVSVEDTGLGLVQEQLQRIFTPLHTSKPDGMGMGLPISRTIIEAHGGRIWATSQPGCGTSLHFTLPVDAEANRDE